MANVTKRDLVVELSNKSGLKQSQVTDLVESFIDLAAKKLAEGNDITLRGFGTFEIRIAKAKIGRNPNQPNSEVRIPDRCIVRFKPGRILKDQVASLPVAKYVAGQDGSKA